MYKDNIERQISDAKKMSTMTKKAQEDYKLKYSLPDEKDHKKPDQLKYIEM